ncbi:MAG: ABC transporter ATP-binding protein [Ignavibacteriales bacterium]|nr:ABC transporter ATP-binding protein [Ignavibacteriales bacterium]
MNEIIFKTEGLAKTFNRRKIFKDISFELKENSSLAITGKNGSGKSTLLKILSGILSPTRGSIEMNIGGKIIRHDSYFKKLGLVSPYLQLYDEFTGQENLELFRDIRGIEATDNYIEDLLKLFKLWERRDDFVRTYSSGMKQRLKYAFALLHNPSILLLDEPRSNLDAEGIETVYKIMEEQKKRGILIVATNDSEDIEHCEQLIDLNKQETSGK